MKLFPALYLVLLVLLVGFTWFIFTRKPYVPSAPPVTQVSLLVPSAGIGGQLGFFK